LRRCSRETTAVARSMAAVGGYAEPRHVAELGGVPVDRVRAGIRDLTETGLLGHGRAGGFQPRHTRSAVLSDIPLRDRPALHGRAAEVLHAIGAPAVVVAENLISA